jgi:hypothetical protein
MFDVDDSHEGSLGCWPENPHSADARTTFALLMVPGERVVRRATAGAAGRAGWYQVSNGAACLWVEPGRDWRFQSAIERLEAAERLDPVSIEYHMGLACRHEDKRRERQTSIAFAKESDSSGMP